MNKVEFDKIKDDAKKFKYSAFEYTDYDDVKNYELQFDKKEVVLLFGYNREAKIYEYIWAANHADILIDSLKHKEEYILSFIPKEWIINLENAGLRIRNAWHDYYLDDLDKKDIKTTSAYNFLKSTETDEASNITLQCKDLSRGFTGQTPEWFNEWLNEKDIKYTAVLVERTSDTSDDKISGLVCVGLYGHESDSGPITWIREAAVSPEHQKKGIGRKLITQALKYGIEKGAKKAFLAVDEDNKNAIRLYTSLGFKPGSDDSEITMIKS